MEIKRGIPVSPGVAIGPALVLDSEAFRIEKFIEPGSYPGEIQRLREAFKSATGEIKQEQRDVNEKLGKQYGDILAAHAVLIDDPSLWQDLQALIRDQSFTAEHAVSKVMRRRAKLMESLSHMAGRTADIVDIEKRLLRHLRGAQKEDLTNLREPVVLLARDLTPSETAHLDRQFILGLATEVGGSTSHTAILAKAHQLPAVVGLGRFLTDASGGDMVIVDGHKGLLIFNPDEETLERYERARQSFVTFEQELLQQKDLPAITKDGARIYMLGNIEFPHEAAHCLERGAEGVGLYRTEFLYLDQSKGKDPPERAHFDAYMEVLKELGSKPVVIRTLDLGADKFADITDPHQTERNPFLGVRSVRLCLRNISLFKTQMRAILRASAFGDVRIMFPMISTLRELRECKMLLREVMEDLDDEGIAFNRKLPIGTMIEVPSAAIMADALAKEVNFFSLGTNDLTQYTLAADRTNENMAALYNPADPAVLWLIRRVLDAAREANVAVNVCGEMSGDPLYTILLIGLGLRQLSATPQNIPEIKKLIRSIDASEAKKVADEVLGMEVARDINNYLREQTRRALPGAVE